MEKICGIYCIKNVFRNQMYIGKSINIQKRILNHYSHLYNNKHHSHKLQASWNKYPDEYFISGIIEECPIELLDQRESYYINLYDTYNTGFNETIPNGENSGHLFTNEDKVKHSIAIRKSRLKWSKEDWDKNFEALAKGRERSLLVDRKHGILLYDARTFLFYLRLDSVQDCADYLLVSKNAVASYLSKMKSHEKLSFHGYIVILDNGNYSIDDYIKSRNEYDLGVKYRKAIKSGLAIINKQIRINNNIKHKIDNTENRLAAWKRNSDMATAKRMLSI